MQCSGIIRNQYNIFLGRKQSRTARVVLLLKSIRVAYDSHGKYSVPAPLVHHVGSFASAVPATLTLASRTFSGRVLLTEGARVARPVYRDLSENVSSWRMGHRIETAHELTAPLV